MSNIKTYISVFLVSMIVAFYGCGDMESIHEQYLQGEKIYAGKLDSLQVYSGYHRVKIVGETRYLGNSIECVVKWGEEEAFFSIEDVSEGTFEMYIDNLEERSYEFSIYTIDTEENQSILQTVRGKSIGDVFKDAQMARRITGYELSESSLNVIWADKAESEFVVSTLFSYEMQNGQMSTAIVSPEDDTTTIDNWKVGGMTTILSKIVTGEMGIDTIDLASVGGQLPVL